MPKEEVKEILKKAWIVSKEDENISVFRECSLWTEEEEMLEYREEESFIKRWLKEWCG